MRPSDPGSPDHYFTRQPASAGTERELTVRLRGTELAVTTAAGTFSPARLDLGTQVLLRTVPPPPDDGNLLDLGCGWGPLALAMATESPGATVWAVDVNERSLDLTRRNAARHHLEGIRAAHPDQVPPETAFAAIWSNPPIRIGKAALHTLLAAWLPRLAPGGEAHLVVQRNLGADPLHRHLAESLGGGFTVGRSASAKGFRVLRIGRVS